MAKQTDITGTFRVPEEAWGRFWNLMLTIDGADITPNTRAQPNGAAKPKRTNGKTSEGNTGRCIILAALAPKHTIMTATQLNELMVEAGKSPKSLHGLLHTMVKAKQLKRTTKGYSITPAGRTFMLDNCSL